MENENIEYKKSLSVKDEILESVVALANANGGRIYIGIDDSKKIVGVIIGRNTLENLANDILREIEPRLTVSIDTENIEEKTVIVIKVPASSFKPHFFKGVAYIRVGKTNQKLSSSQLEDLFIKRALSLHDVDNLELNILKDDISEDLLVLYIKEISKNYHDFDRALKSLGLSDNETIYPSAVLFFGINPAGFFPLYGVKCAVFRGQEMISIEDFSDPIYLIVNKVVQFIKQNTPSTIKFEGIKRFQEAIIPEIVIREAVLNSLIHADYTLDATIYVKITEDFIEIKNGGILPMPLTISELDKPHISKPRNKRIASLCHLIGWIEHWGEGTLRIVNIMRASGLEVEFEEKNGYFSVKLFLKPITLNLRQEKILEVIRINKEITVKNLKLNKPARTIRADLLFLVRKGFIKKIGKGKNTKYTL